MMIASRNYFSFNCYFFKQLFSDRQVDTFKKIILILNFGSLGIT